MLRLNKKKLKLFKVNLNKLFKKLKKFNKKLNKLFFKK